MSWLAQDLRFGARMLRKAPGFTLAAIITLALAIGANTAIFSVTNALLLRPFPYREPQQLVSVDARSPDTKFGTTLLRYELVRDHNKVFEAVGVYTNDNFNLTGRGEPLQVAVARVSANFFSILGVQPQLGRNFSEEEGRPEGKPVVMISDALWRSRFGGDRNVVGQSVNLDTTPHTVIGVLPRDVQFPFVGQADIWTPRYFEYTLMTPQRLRMGVGYLDMIARLRPGTSMHQADAELAVLNREYREQNPTAPDADRVVTMAATPLRDLVVANIRVGILALTMFVGVVLLIGCANVASLLLSRALARRREAAVRTALGASRVALVRQFLTESVLLSLLSGALGLGLAFAATRYLVTAAVNDLPRGIPISIDADVLLFTTGISVLTGLLFGILPALQLSRTNVNETLRDEGRGSSSSRRRVQLKGLLVVGQVALSLLLLIGAGLLVRSFVGLLHVDPGFDAHSLLTMNVSLPTVKYAKPEQQIAFFDELLRRVSAAPGVRDAAVSAALPLSWKRITPVLPEGHPDVPLPQRPFVDIEAISPLWFRTMRVPLLTGRWFSDADNGQAPKVVIVNDTFARRYWPNQSAIGKHIIVGRGPSASEVVGVAADIKNKGLAEDTQAQLYLPFAQLPWGNMNLLVRTNVEPRSILSTVRGEVAAVDPDQPVTNVQTADELMDASRAQPRLTMLLLAAFSVTALILAMVGLYGVLAYTVEQRRQELGIRLALGAERSDILRLVVKQGLALTAGGVVIGIVVAGALSLALRRLVSSVLYKVSTHDFLTFVVVPLAFLGVAFLASYLPGRRATKVDPTEALRHV